VTNHILIVDSDKAFATILKEGIEMDGDNQAAIVTTALEARDVAARGHLSMAIVDMGLPEDEAAGLLQALRAQHAALRLMAIPAGELPEEVLALGLQGTLSKPFFLPDIPAQIEAALSRPAGVAMAAPDPDPHRAELIVEQTALAPAVGTRALAAEPAGAETSPELLAHLARESQRLTEHLRYLSRELNADAVLLTMGPDLLAYAGHYGRPEAERLAQVVNESWQASARVAAALGREQVRFEQSLHEGEDYLLYSLAASGDIVLSVALHAERPLGMIRYNTKQTAKELERILRPR
jgi:DNA-binding response OmpR family regulator